MPRYSSASSNDVYTLIGALVTIVISLAVIAAVILLGPACLAYDLNVILPMVKDTPVREISMWEPAVFICGVIFSQATIPVALLLWLLQSCGAI